MCGIAGIFAYADDARNGLLAWQREIGQRYAPLSADRKRALLQRIDATTRRNMHTDWLPIRRVVESA